MDKPIQKKKWPASKLIFMIGSIGLIVFMVFVLGFANNNDSLDIDAKRITISQVITGEFEEYIPITGNVLPHTTVYLDLQEGGIVEQVYVQGGVPINKGDLILSFSNTAVQKQNIDSETRLLENLNQLRNSKLQLTQSQLILKDQRLELNHRILELEKTYQRYAKLMESTYSDLSKEQFETTRDNLKYLKEKRDLLDERIRQESILEKQQSQQIADSIERVNRSLDILSRIIESLEVRAPISGHLSSMNVEIGQNFTRGQRIGQIDQLDSFKVRASIDQYYISKIVTGQLAGFDFNGEEYKLEVSKIFPEVINDSFQVDMEFVGEIPNGIKRGQTLQIEISLSKSDTTRLAKKGGFYRYTSGRWVYRVTPDGKSAERIDIVSGRQNPQSFEILDGLVEGDWIISSGYSGFNDAQELYFDEPVVFK